MALAELNIEKAFDVAFRGHANRNVFCPYHENEDSKTPSCSVSADGLFHCKSCEAKGTADKFYAKVHHITYAQARKQLRLSEKEASRRLGQLKQPKVRRITDALVRRCQEMLLKNKLHLKHLTGARGLTPETLAQYQVGCDEYRITIPVRDVHGRLLSIRRYSPSPSSHSPKMISHLGGDGTPHLYPQTILNQLAPNAQLVLCEGEWDALLLNQANIPALTVTSGVTTWASQFTDVIKAYRVIIIYDVNDKEDDLGQRTANERAALFLHHGMDVSVLELPLPSRYVGGDITDYLVREQHGTDELLQLIGNVGPFQPVAPAPAPTPTHAPSPVAAGNTHAAPSVPKEAAAPLVPLSLAASAKYFYQDIRVRALVAGKGASPYLIPHKVTLELKSATGDKQTIKHTFDMQDGSTLSLLKCPASTQKKVIKGLCGIPADTSVHVTVDEAINVEEVFLIPAIEQQADVSPSAPEQGQYTLRRCFYVGAGLNTNRVYEFEGYTLPEPRTQEATHVFTAAHPSETYIDNFTLSKKEIEELRSVFGTEDPHGKLEAIATQLADHITHIYGRTDLHIAVDLVYHSPLSFNFDGLHIHKGWLEALVMGDTRTGKGRVTETLSRHYQAGEVISGENLSLAGLVGGIQKMGDRYTLVWGKIPLADRRLIILDECGSMSTDDIARLSRVRSEGVAEITKILAEKTTARTRLIWLGNPRPSGTAIPRMLADYNYGVEAIAELVGAAEDVARFDFALTVAQNEVSSKEINKRHRKPGKLAYTSKLCNRLLAWCWSRRSSQVQFTSEAVTTVLKAAQILGQQFSPKVCLVQAEDVRFKLARIAAAAAARTFNSPDGQRLVVTETHVHFAFNFLHHLYEKPSCGYLQLSSVERERSVLRNAGAVRAILDTTSSALEDLVDGLLEHQQITPRDLADYAGIDRYQAQSMVSEFVREHALVKQYAYYVKRPAFKVYLQQLKRELTTTEHITQPEEPDNDQSP